jgi:hypothetical protein
MKYVKRSIAKRYPFLHFWEKKVEIFMEIPKKFK